MNEYIALHLNIALYSANTPSLGMQRLTGFTIYRALKRHG